LKNSVVGNNSSRPLDINEFRAFALIDEYAPLIFINSKDSLTGQVFSLVHEFVHICLGIDSLYNVGQDGFPSANPVESFCNRVTAEVLIPVDLFGEKWIENTGDQKTKFSALSGYFKCSQLAIARRALDLGFIKPEEYIYASRTAKMVSGKQKSPRVPSDKLKASRIDHNFIIALYSSVREGKTLYTDAYRLTDTNRVTFDGLVKEVRGAQK
jgi:Zn-dependent peptidase ImmA (M78 family)